MNSKERVRNAVRQLPSDRVPTNYGDFSWIGLPNTRTNRPDGGVIDEWGVVNIPRDGMCHGERIHPVTTIAALVAYPFPDPLRPERWDGVLERIAAARDSWTMVCLGPAIWEQIHFLCPMEDAMAWLYEYPDEMGAVADRLVEFHLAELGRLAGSGVDCVFFQDDWGLQNGLLISPALWREFFRPRYARLFGRCRELGIATFLHSCGHILEIMPDLADIGLDILQMQQPDCMGLDKILAVCRGRLTLAIMPDIQTCLPHATAEEVRRVSAQLLEATGAGRGGMIADNYGHWPAGIPPENIAAWHETVANWPVTAAAGKEAGR
jgi:uroporphyrinogen-III decarboxylase